MTELRGRGEAERSKGKPLTKTFLEAATCESDGCGFTSNKLVLASRCHTGSPMFLDDRTPGVATFRCIQPPFDVVTQVKSIKVRLVDGGAFNDHGLFTATCHDTSAVCASYQYGSGRVAIDCYHCKKLVAEIEVAAEGPGK